MLECRKCGNSLAAGFRDAMTGLLQKCMKNRAAGHGIRLWPGRTWYRRRKVGTMSMEILGKTLSEKAEKLYNEITGELIYPVNILKMDPENTEGLQSSGGHGHRKERVYRQGGTADWKTICLRMRW